MIKAMLYWPNSEQRQLFRRNAKPALVQTIFVLPGVCRYFRRGNDPHSSART